MSKKSAKHKKGQDPNENCLQGIACPKCGVHESFLIEISGVVEGTKRQSIVWAKVYDDGTESPTFEGDTEWDETSKIECVECEAEGVVKDFTFEYDED